MAPSKVQKEGKTDLGQQKTWIFSPSIWNIKVLASIFLKLYLLLKELIHFPVTVQLKSAC